MTKVSKCAQPSVVRRNSNRSRKMNIAFSITVVDVPDRPTTIVYAWVSCFLILVMVVSEIVSVVVVVVVVVVVLMI